MKLEEQVCTKNQSVRMKGYGVNLRTNYYWVEGKLGREYLAHYTDKKITEAIDLNYPLHFAPTTAEFGLLLPWVINMGEELILLWRRKTQSGKFLIRFEISPTESLHKIIGLNEAEALAEAFIWLLKTDLLKPKELHL